MEETGFNVICIDTKAFYALVDKVVEHIKQRENITDERWITPEEAMKILNIKTTALQALRNSGEIAYSQRNRKNILYDRYSILAHLERHKRRTFK